MKLSGVDSFLINEIGNLVDFLYWKCGCDHDGRSADAYDKILNELTRLEIILNDCINLLKQSGINSKEIVRMKLEVVVYGAYEA